MELLTLQHFAGCVGQAFDLSLGESTVPLTLQDSSVARDLLASNSEIAGFVPKFSKDGDKIVQVSLRSGMPVFYRRPDLSHENAVDRLKGTLFVRQGSQLKTPVEPNKDVRCFSVQELTAAPTQHDGWTIVPYTYALWSGGNQLYDYSFLD